jgi:hypothetical protein
VEYKQLRKANTFIDRRFGGASPRVCVFLCVSARAGGGENARPARRGPALSILHFTTTQYTHTRARARNTRARSPTHPPTHPPTITHAHTPSQHNATPEHDPELDEEDKALARLQVQRIKEAKRATRFALPDGAGAGGGTRGDDGGGSGGRQRGRHTLTHGGISLEELEELNSKCVLVLFCVSSVCVRVCAFCVGLVARARTVWQRACCIAWRLQHPPHNTRTARPLHALGRAATSGTAPYFRCPQHCHPPAAAAAAAAAPRALLLLLPALLSGCG